LASPVLCPFSATWIVSRQYLCWKHHRSSCLGKNLLRQITSTSHHAHCCCNDWRYYPWTHHDVQPNSSSSKSSISSSMSSSSSIDLRHHQISAHLVLVVYRSYSS
jgi:hypothetical protein